MVDGKTWKKKKYFSQKDKTKKKNKNLKNGKKNNKMWRLFVLSSQEVNELLLWGLYFISPQIKTQRIKTKTYENGKTSNEDAETVRLETKRKRGQNYE